MGLGIGQPCYGHDSGRLCPHNTKEGHFLAPSSQAGVVEGSSRLPPPFLRSILIPTTHSSSTVNVLEPGDSEQGVLAGAYRTRQPPQSHKQDHVYVSSLDKLQIVAKYT